MKLKYLKIALIVVLVCKLLAVLAGSYPFDFASFVYQPRNFFEYNIDPLFYWNKGMPLLAMFYSCYAFYQFLITTFFQSFENTILLHLIYKLPLFGADILIAFLLYRIVKLLQPDVRYAKLAAIMWLLNPFAVWSTEFQGSYAVYAALFMIGSIYLLLKKRVTLSAVCLAVSASVYYYSIVLLPFYALYVLLAHKLKASIKYTIVFIGTVTLCYLPFFMDRGALHDLANSLLNHSGPSSGQYEAITYLPTYSLLNIPYYLVAGELPNSATAPWIFLLHSSLTLAGLAFVASFILYRIVKIYKQRQYDIKTFLWDLITTLTIFMVFIGQFQNHYLTWLLPLLIVVGITYRKLVLITAQYSVLVVLAVIAGAVNLGIYLLDIVPFGTINAYTPLSREVQALGGFTLLILLLANIYLINGKLKLASQHFRTIIQLNFAAIFIIGSFAAIGLLSSSLSTTRQLGSDQNVTNFAYVTPTPPKKKSENVKVEQLRFTGQDFSQPQSRISTNTRLANSNWYLYQYRGDGKSVVDVVSDGLNGKGAVSVKPSRSDAVQLNLGTDIKRQLPLIAERHELYTASVFVKATNAPESTYQASLRFKDTTGEVISGSDIKLTRQGEVSSGWHRYMADFRPPYQAAFVEPLLSVDTTRSNGLSSPQVLFSNVEVYAYRTYADYEATAIKPKNNAETLGKEVFKAGTIERFIFKVRVELESEYQRVDSLTFNGCKPTDTQGGFSSITYIFESTCANKNSNSVKATLSNFTDEPLIAYGLVHKNNPQPKVFYHHQQYYILLVLGLVLCCAAAGLVGYLASRIVREEI